MNSEVPAKFSLRTHVLSAFITHLVFAIPSLLLFIALRPIGLRSLFLIFGMFSFGSLLIGFFSWMIDKGSSGENSMIAISSHSGIPSKLYGFFIGSTLGFQFGGTMCGIIGAILFLLIGRWIGLRIGSSLSLNVANYIQHSLIDESGKVN